MSRLLGCPKCHAQFAFDDWARATSCPACGRRLTFFEASAAAPPASTSGEPTPSAAAAPTSGESPSSSAAPPTAASAPSAPAGAAWTWSEAGGAATAVAPPPAATAPPEEPSAAALPDPAADPLPGASLPVAAPLPLGASSRPLLTLGDKPLQWSRGWTIVLAIWIAVAAGLIAVRVEMGPVTVMTPTEHAAVGAVRAIKLPTGAATETVLRYAATHDLTLEGHVAKIPPGGTQMWYAFNRPWEHRIYVYTELPGTSMMGKNVVLSWTVSGGVAKADGVTRAALTKTAQTMAHPPSPNSVPAVPGIIPSIPPDLQ